MDSSRSEHGARGLRGDDGPLEDPNHGGLREDRPGRVADHDGVMAVQVGGGVAEFERAMTIIGAEASAASAPSVWNPLRLLAADALEGVLQDVVCHLDARCLAVIARTSKVNAGKDASFLHFLERRSKAGE